MHSRKQELAIPVDLSFENKSSRTKRLRASVRDAYPTDSYRLSVYAEKSAWNVPFLRNGVVSVRGKWNLYKNPFVLGFVIGT
jgi:hypothetical protein